MYNAGNPKLVLCDNWRDMVGKEVHGGLGWRGHIYLYLLPIAVCQKPSQFVKNYPPIKIIFKKRIAKESS